MYTALLLRDCRQWTVVVLQDSAAFDWNCLRQTWQLNWVMSRELWWAQSDGTVQPHPRLPRDLLRPADLEVSIAPRAPACSGWVGYVTWSRRRSLACGGIAGRRRTSAGATVHIVGGPSRPVSMRRQQTRRERGLTQQRTPPSRTSTWHLFPCLVTSRRVADHLLQTNDQSANLKNS